MLPAPIHAISLPPAPFPVSLPAPTPSSRRCEFRFRRLPPGAVSSGALAFLTSGAGNSGVVSLHLSSVDGVKTICVSSLLVKKRFYVGGEITQLFVSRRPSSPPPSRRRTSRGGCLQRRRFFSARIKRIVSPTMCVWKKFCGNHMDMDVVLFRVLFVLALAPLFVAPPPSGAAIPGAVISASTFPHRRRLSPHRRRRLFIHAIRC